MDEVKISKSFNILQKLGLEIKKKVTHETALKELEILAKVIAVSIYADNERDPREIAKAQEIIDEAIKLDKKLVADMVADLLKIYVNQKWQWQQDYKEVIRYVVRENNWIYAEYMIQLIEADGIIRLNERNIFDALKDMIQAKKRLEAELGFKL